MAHIRLTQTLKDGKAQVLNVNRIGRDGEITFDCCFVNDLSPRENMITLWLMEHHIGNVLDERMRLKAAKEIKISSNGKLIMFFIGDETFITAPVIDKKGKVVWDAN